MLTHRARWNVPVLLLALAATPVFVGNVACEGTRTSDVDVQLLKEAEMETALGDSASVVVDVRKPERFAKGHIPGAINIFLPNITAGDNRLGMANRIVVYAGGYTDPLGIAAAKRLLALGYQNVYLYSPGFEIWQSSGHQIAQSAAPSEQRPETGKAPAPQKNTK